ncbi:hypothetical protein OHA72_06285 [Dactylosporangium sp. NBC_01737]|uniref:hypothetical protein n=1 Tax=Dactylosporangium sp. NBC_01737 TaxID=2975959 RepID=UPI002E126FEC|nr:hypothetical protein OHA72_06285 [Dactylosporangium sp. NBC_01737]
MLDLDVNPTAARHLHRHPAILVTDSDTTQVRTINEYLWRFAPSGDHAVRPSLMNNQRQAVLIGFYR